MRSMIFAVQKIEEWLCSLLMAVMTCVVFYSVVLRYGLNNPIGWADEIAKICFTWLVFLGGAVGIRKGAHISIDFFVHLLPATARRVIGFTSDFLIAAILLVIFYYGIRLCSMTAQVTTPILDISIAFIYGAAPATVILMMFHHLYRMATAFREKKTD